MYASKVGFKFISCSINQPPPPVPPEERDSHYQHSSSGNRSGSTGGVWPHAGRRNTGPLPELLAFLPHPSYDVDGADDVFNYRLSDYYVHLVHATLHASEIEQYLKQLLHTGCIGINVATPPVRRRVLSPPRSPLHGSGGHERLAAVYGFTFAFAVVHRIRSLVLSSAQLSWVTAYGYAAASTSAAAGPSRRGGPAARPPPAHPIRCGSCSRCTLRRAGPHPHVPP